MLKTLLLSFLIASGFPARAAFKSADEAVQKLRSYKVEDFKRGGEKSDEKIDAHEDQFFEDLDEAVKFASTHKVNQSFLETVARAAALSLQYDDTAYAGEVILPLYKRDQKSFRAALKKLSAQDAEKVEESLKDKERESTEGNG